MNADLQKQVAALTDLDALVAARSPLTLLDLKLKSNPDAARPANINPADLPKLAGSGGAATAELEKTLNEAGSPETAAAARGLLLLCVDLGYATEVKQACQSAGLHVRDMGVLSGPVIVAALAAVIAWVPIEQKKRVKEQTTIGKDGTVVTSKEMVDETRRVGAAALKALTTWWTKCLSP